MTFSLIHYGEIDGAYDSETSNTVSMYSPNICLLGCNREIKIIYLIPHFSSRWHLLCPSAREHCPGRAQLSGAQEGTIIAHFSLVLHHREGGGGIFPSFDPPANPRHFTPVSKQHLKLL